MSYTVWIDDNFHYMEAEHRRRDSEWEDAEAAEQRCRSIVDDYLQSAHQPGMTWRQLFDSYTTFGEDPWIATPDGDQPAFSAWDYARERCQALCGGPPSGGATGP
jgi:hypothetical protein